ncbi:rhomboid family protein [Bacillus sp. V33-4]|uniref:rhomboid family protein n=1 Tax=Bacillus sp. V33-4 TaxID=2054169 RepID=UPI000C78F305|nr:rhomboid family intramembrane serine protease [Bacillus sp. V33-4]PLR87691.1 rhomboid family intramembrane serine protease [Bacillus sp. V33-4]
MSFREDYLFWRLALYFISKQHYRIVQLSNEQTELWLEKTEQKQAQIIRLVRYNLDWGNWLQRDIELTATNGERIRKQLRHRELKVVNIYVTPYPPVDDYSFHIEKPYSHPDLPKTMVSTHIIDRANGLSALEAVGQYFHDSISFTANGEYTEQDVEAVKQAALTEAVNKAKKEKAVFEYGRPFFSYIFIAIQVMMFLILELNGGSTNTATLIEYGAKSNPHIIAGEWWRFFTPIVLHIGILHLFMNTLALFYLGPLIERIYGNIRFVVIYLFAGFTGSLASFAFSPSLSAGASGAIFGCFGALLYFGLIHPKLFFRTMGMNVIVVIAINLGLGFAIPGIDNAGHIGGLAGGFLAAGVVHFPEKKKLLMQLLFLILSIGSIRWLLNYGYEETARTRDEQLVLSLAGKYAESQQYDQTYKTLLNYPESENRSAQFLYALAFTELKLGMNDEAKGHLLETIEKESRFDEAHYYLAWVLFTERKVQEAQTHAENAVKIKPSNEEYQQLLKRINDYPESAAGG